MLRSFRKLIALIGIAAVLFSQFAVSAHGCQMLQSVGNHELSMTMDLTAAGESDIAQPPLCQKHCHDDKQNFGDLPSPLGSVALAPSFIFTLADAPPPRAVASATTTALRHATAPPLAIRNCCFRI